MILSREVLIIIFLLIILFLPIEAQKKVKYDGFIELGIRAVYNELHVNSYVRSKLEVKLELNKRTEIEIDIRAFSDDEEIELREASLDYELSNSVEIELGQLKKDYGREESKSREKLTTINRSLVNRFLSPFGYVSRDPGISVVWETDHHEFTSGLFYNNTQDLTLMSRYLKDDLIGFDKIGASLRWIKHFKREGLNTSYAAGLEFLKKFGTWDNELELFYGIDPLATGFNNIIGLDNNVNFFAAKFQSAYKFKFDNVILTGIEPVIITALVVPDANEFDVNQYQILAGLNIYIDEDIRLMINGDLILSNNQLNKSDRSIQGSNVIAQFQVRW